MIVMMMIVMMIVMMLTVVFDDCNDHAAVADYNDNVVYDNVDDDIHYRICPRTLRMHQAP